MSSTVILGGVPVALDSEAGHAFVVDAVRSAEGLICDKDLVEIYGVSPPELQALAKDGAFAKAVRNERDRRVRSGTAAREAASKHFVKAPGVLDQIMTDAQSNPRHKIEAIRELRQVALPESNAPTANEDKFTIVINLGADTETYTENRAITPEQPKIIDNETTPKLVERPKRGRPPKLTIVDEDSDER
jgi:hypothetical protein